MVSFQMMYASARMVDGTTHVDVPIIGADRLKYSRTAHKHGWPAFGANGDVDLWQHFVTWSALARTGAYTGTWDAFGNDVALVVVRTEEDETVDPTRTAATPV